MIKNHLIISLNHNAQTTNLHKNSLLFSPRKQNIKKIKKMAQDILLKVLPWNLSEQRLLGHYSNHLSQALLVKKKDPSSLTSSCNTSKIVIEVLIRHGKHFLKHCKMANGETQPWIQMSLLL